MDFKRKILIQNVEDENCVPHKPQMRGNEEEKMEETKVKTILILELQMKHKLLDDNYINEELVVHIEVDYEV